MQDKFILSKEACACDMFTNIPKTNNECRFISEEDNGGNISSFMANHRLCTQGRNDHLGCNSSLEVEGKFVLSFPEVIQLPALFAVSSLNLSCKCMITAQMVVLAVHRRHK